MESFTPVLAFEHCLVRCASSIYLSGGKQQEVRLEALSLFPVHPSPAPSFLLYLRVQSILGKIVYKANTHF
jgi:hypothetical protein